LHYRGDSRNGGAMKEGPIKRVLEKVLGGCVEPRLERRV